MTEPPPRLKRTRSGNTKDPPPKPTYRSVKTSLKSIVKNNLVTEKLTDLTLRVNSIMIHALQLLQLYLLHSCDVGDELPKLDRRFVTSVMKVLCKAPPTDRPPSTEMQIIVDTLKDFYEQRYKAYMSEELSYEHMRHHDQIPLDRRDHHVRKQHQAELCRGQGRLAQATPAEDVGFLYHAWIDEQRKLVLPARNLKKDNVHYDIQCSPQDYLPCMLRMMKAVEVHDTSVKNACPLRSNDVPKHVCIDTTSLVNLCFTEEHGKQTDYLKGDDNLDVRKESSCRKESSWGIFFKTNMKSFSAKGYTFDHQIVTDGVGCRILLKRKDLSDERVIQGRIGKCETYIDEVVDCEHLNDKTVVVIDLNMSDMLYCIDGDTKNQTRSRYTQDTRRRETKAKTYRDFVQERKQEVRIDGKRVDEWEAELSAYNRKTTDFECFKAYVEKKNEMNRRLS